MPANGRVESFFLPVMTIFSRGQCPRYFLVALKSGLLWYSMACQPLARRESMFRLYHSNDLEILKGILVHQMQESPVGPFGQEAILVQSQGMSHWLKLQLADSLGIAAQVDFPLPSSFVWQVFNRLKPELPERSHFDKQIMAWKLVRLLPALATQPGCEAIAHYLQNDADGVKCYQLAQTIADVFDQYLVYRPDWLLSWELGEDEVADTQVSAHPWQPLVWRALVADSARLGHSLDHRARLLQELEQLVQAHPERLADLPKRLFVFGIAALPGSYWQVLQAISPVIEVHFFLLNPCKNFWGDIVSDRQKMRILRDNPDSAHLLDRGNPLLASWGRLGRDFLTLVHETAEQYEGRIQDVDAYIERGVERDVERGPQTLLAHLQQDILTLTDRQQGAFSKEAQHHSEFKQGVAAADGSVRLISAHSPLREVQRLYDQILYWLDNDPELKPRDIVVMVPDIDQYAPYIDAVFASSRARTENGAEYRIPWAIADQSMAQEDALIDSFLSLLGLADSRLLITEVQDWLDVAAIRNRFAISEDHLSLLRDWLAQAQIRWGLDSQQRGQLGLPAFEQNSWRKGLRQLLLGYLTPDSRQDFMGDFPVSATEGNEGELLGHLMAFIDALEHWQKVLSSGHCSVAQWSDALQSMLNDLYLADNTEQNSLQRIRDAIQRWQEELTLAGFNGELSAPVVRSWFNEQLGQQGGWQRFLAGPVNFCTLMPMRSIPFKAVCLLGMNDEDYPRRVTPVGFDLMVSGRSRRGDRSRREDDRYLFLEAVCSAQDYLYISYRGHDVRENAELQPSVLVAELRDYLCDGYCLETDRQQPHQQSRSTMLNWLQEELPLQPYNRLAFSNDHGDAARHVRSYQQVWAEVAAQQSSPADAENDHFFSEPLTIPADIDTSQVAWEDVKQALADPLKYFVTRRLKASFDVYWQQHETEEPFALNGLDLYQLKDDWLQLAMADIQQGHAKELSDELAFTRRQQALGQLPVNALGKVWSDNLIDYSRPLAHKIVALSEFRMDVRALTLTLEQGPEEPCSVHGELQQAFVQQPTDSTGYLLYYRVGDLRGRHLLQAWLDALLVAAAAPGTISHVRLLGLSKDKGSVWLREVQLALPTGEEAIALVRQAVAWYWQCWCEPLAHLPDTLWSLIQAQERISEKHADDADAQADAMQKEISKLVEQDFGELASPYLQRCLPDFVAQLQSQLPDQWLAEQGILLTSLKKYIKTDELHKDSAASYSGGEGV
ncbi:MAG: exodeoxyribonuclease V subunit gamma [Thalassobium sp.]|nr:MAG: exodeoxyribonuclease V subunit gamma [Thalassobium sp.]